MGESRRKYDQRLKYIKLTERGKQFNKQSKEIINTIVSDILHDLSDEQMNKHVMF